MIGTSETRFNLTTEPWVPVRWADGTRGEVSLSVALKRAQDIRDVEGDIPQQVLPLIRVMLAVLYAAVPSEGDETYSGLESLWQEVWRAGSFDKNAIDGYFDDLGNRFDLFDADHPFYQVANLEYAKGGFDGIDELMADVPKPDKFLFSMSDRGRVTSLAPAEAARWLVFQQAYAMAGIKTPVRGNTHVNKGKAYAPKGVVGTGLLGAEGPVYLEGDSLFQTLMLNWVLFDEQARGKQLYGNLNDAPVWERDDAVPDMVFTVPDRPYGPAESLTWQSRRMRLVADENGRVVGVISCYGDVIRSLDDRQVSETMTSWRERNASDLAYVPRAPRTHNPSRAVWRGLASMVAYDGEVDLRPGVMRWIERLTVDGVLGRDEPSSIRVHVQGMSYGTQSSVFSDGIDDAMSISRALVRHESEACREAVSVVSQVDRAVSRYCGFLRDVWKANGRKTTGSRSQVQVINAECDKAREAAYAGLDELCRQRIAAFPGDEEAAFDYANRWRSDVRRGILRMADEYMRSVGGSVFSEHDGMTVGRASKDLGRDLMTILGLAGGTRGEGK